MRSIRRAVRDGIFVLFGLDYSNFCVISGGTVQWPQQRNSNFRQNAGRLHGKAGNRSRRRFRPKTYEASPIALCWEDENYYLVAYGAPHGLTH